MAASAEISDIDLIAPALLQLNRAGEKASVPFESCPSPACGVPITTFPDCPDCLDADDLNLQCDTCWTECASPCNDDDCHIPQPCYEDHCAIDSCADATCAAEACTDVTCPETVHCNATCFDTSCLYNFGDDSAEFNAQECGQGQCFGFLPPGPGFGSFDPGYQCPQAGMTHQFSAWDLPTLPDHGFQHHDHVDGNRHKRRRVESEGYASLDQQSEGWSGDNMSSIFSPDALNFNLDHTTFPTSFDFSCEDDCHHHLKHNESWAGDIASSLPCGPVTKQSFGKQRKRPHQPVKLLPAPGSFSHTASIVAPVKPAAACTHKDFICLWSSNGKPCNHRFSSAKDLDDHLQSAHTSKLGPQNFVCHWEGCNTTFKHRGKLNRHISGAHSKYHAHVCTHVDPTTGEPCGRTFCTKEQLKNHETTHTGERKYKCKWCGHTSATKTQHNTHERIHTGDKPYVCPVEGCGHRSGDSSNLSKHVRNKHPGFVGKVKDARRKSVELT